MEEIKIGGKSNGKSLENAITFMKYLEELETNKLYGIKKCGSITLLTKTECVPISVIENEIEELSAMKLTDTIAKAEVNFAIVTLEDIIYEERRRNNTDV